MTFITFGEGRRIPAVGAAGAVSKMVDAKVGRIEVQARREGGDDPQERDRNPQAGRDGHKSQSRRRRLRQSFERPIDKIVWDVKNGLVSRQRRARRLRRRHRQRQDTRCRYRPRPKNCATPLLEETPRQRSGIIMRTKYRLGIDAGGTFTDLVLADRSGDVRLYKALSTPGRSDARDRRRHEIDRRGSRRKLRPRSSRIPISASTAPPSASMP